MHCGMDLPTGLKVDSQPSRYIDSLTNNFVCKSGRRARLIVPMLVISNVSGWVGER